MTKGANYERILLGYAKGEEVEACQTIREHGLLAGTRGTVVQPRRLVQESFTLSNRVVVAFDLHRGRVVIALPETAIRPVYAARREDLAA